VVVRGAAYLDEGTRIAIRRDAAAARSTLPAQRATTVVP
jgi:hypothetical protein